MRRSRKPLNLHGFRGFESHPHRQNSLQPKSILSVKAVAACTELLGPLVLDHLAAGLAVMVGYARHLKPETVVRFAHQGSCGREGNTDNLPKLVHQISPLAVGSVVG